MKEYVVRYFERDVKYEKAKVGGVQSLVIAANNEEDALEYAQFQLDNQTKFWEETGGETPEYEVLSCQLAELYHRVLPY